MQVEWDGSESRCPRCGGRATRDVSDGVQGGRLVYSVEIGCRDCPYLVLECGAGDLPSSLRAELLAHHGAARVRLDPDQAGPLRVRLLMALRSRGGVSIAAATAEYDRLVGEGAVGTEGEMRLLADRLTAVGAQVSLDLPERPESLA
jgi:hypothetical protein